MIHRHDRVAIVASGPSAKGYEAIPGFVHIAVNNALYELGTSADYWFTLDPSRENREIMERHDYPSCRYIAAVPKWYGSRASPIVSYRKPRVPWVTHLDRVEGVGLSEDRDVIHTGNSAFGALGLAYHMRPKTIIMVGVDGTDQPKVDGSRCKGSLNHLPGLFQSAVVQLERRGVDVINIGRNSRITCFKKMGVNDVLQSLQYDDRIDP